MSSRSNRVSEGGPARATARLLLLCSLFALPVTAGILTLLEVQLDGVAGVDGLLRAEAVTVSPEGRHVYVAGRNDNAIAVFARDATAESLTFVEVQRNGQGAVFGLAGASGVAVSPEGNHLYATGSLDSALTVFARDPIADQLTFVSLEIDGLGGVSGLRGATSVAVAPDGRQVFATGRTLGTLAVFNRDATVADLAFSRSFLDGTGGVDGLDGASSVAVSPDGRQLYAAGFDDDALAVFDREPGTGFVSFREVERRGRGAIGMDGASAVAVSPDNRHVYVAGALDETITLYSRDLGTDDLTFQAVYVEHVDNVRGLAGVSSVTVTPDGRRLLATGALDNSVTIFARNPTTGVLTFVAALADGVDLRQGLDGAAAVAVSPDSRHAYVAANEDNALTAFRIASPPGPRP